MIGEFAVLHVPSAFPGRFSKCVFIDFVVLYVLDPNALPAHNSQFICRLNRVLRIVRKYIAHTVSLDHPSHEITYGGCAISISTKSPRNDGSAASRQQ